MDQFINFGIDFPSSDDGNLSLKLSYNIGHKIIKPAVGIGQIISLHTIWPKTLKTGFLMMRLFLIVGV